MLSNSEVVKDLGIHIHESLSSVKHLEHRVKKANIVLYLLKRNISPKIATIAKLGLYKSVIVPVLVYGLQCVAPTKTELTVIKKFKKGA